MRLDIPRFIEARPGELPQAYFLAGAHVTPLKRIVEADAVNARSLPFPPGLAAIDQIVAAVAKVESGLPRFLPELEASAPSDALRVARENSARLAAHRRDEINQAE